MEEAEELNVGEDDNKGPMFPKGRRGLSQFWKV